MPRQKSKAKSALGDLLSPAECSAQAFSCAVLPSTSTQISSQLTCQMRIMMRSLSDSWLGHAKCSVVCSYCEAINAICAVWLSEQYEMNH